MIWMRGARTCISFFRVANKVEKKAAAAANRAFYILWEEKRHQNEKKNEVIANCRRWASFCVSMTLFYRALALAFSTFSLTMQCLFSSCCLTVWHPIFVYVYVHIAFGSVSLDFNFQFSIRVDYHSFWSMRP